MSEILRLGSFNKYGVNRNVFDRGGLCPTLIAGMDRSDNVPMVIDKIIYDDYNSHVKTDQDTIGTIDSMSGGGRQPHVVEKHMVKLSKGGSQKFKSMDEATIKPIADGVSPTITARYYKGIGADNDNMVIEKTIVPCRLNKHDGENYLPASEHWIGDVDCEISNTITSHMALGPYCHKDVPLVEKAVGVIDYRYDEGVRPRQEFIAPTLNLHTGTASLSGQCFVIVAQRSFPRHHLDEIDRSEIHQRLEPHPDGGCFALTSVEKDNYVIEIVQDKTGD